MEDGPMSTTYFDKPVDREIAEAVQESDAHPDVKAYVEKASERGGTGMLSSLRTFHDGSGVSFIAQVGTAIETTLWNEGAEVCLAKHGHLDTTNEEILEEIVGES